VFYDGAIKFIELATNLIYQAMRDSVIRDLADNQNKKDFMIIITKPLFEEVIFWKLYKKINDASAQPLNYLKTYKRLGIDPEFRRVSGTALIIIK